MTTLLSLLKAKSFVAGAACAGRPLRCRFHVSALVQDCLGPESLPCSLASQCFLFSCD